jgi:predicted NBD/HSP70 family sugar kinase
MLQQVGFGVRFIKDYNELNVLRFIKHHGPISRADISKKQHISKAGISEIVARLIEQDYISETGVGDSTHRGGRRPILLTFNQKAGYVVAIEIKRSFAKSALLDMNATIHDTHIVTFPLGYSLDKVLKRVFPVIHSLLTVDWVKRSRAIGLGIGIPGLIDYDAGCIKLSDSLKSWERYPIRDKFEKEFNIPTIIENDVKTLALGEYLFGKGIEHENLVNLWIGDGIGAGIILNGSLIRGVTASAGEVGYDELGFYICDPHEFPLLYNGQKRFGDILSNRWLVSATCIALKQGYKSDLDEENISPELIVTAAEAGDKLAISILKEYGALLGVLCISLINTLNIELLVICGKILSNSDLLLKFVREKVKNDLLRVPAHAVHIVSSGTKENGVVLGAAGLVLEDLFHQNIINIMKYRSIFKQSEL